MTTDYNNTLFNLEKTLTKYFPHEEIEDWLEASLHPYRELMAFYKCAIMKVETKFNILDETFSLDNDRNPIAAIKSRLKTTRSIVDKMYKYGFPITVESIEENLHDVAGVRVVCSYKSDIYMLADALLLQDDVQLVEKKDYIANPKPNGYRSLHLIISTPIFLHDQKKMMKVEVQLRTLAMDTWASQEHQIRYKKSTGNISPEISQELKECADLCAEMDERMERIRNRIQPTLCNIWY